MFGWASVAIITIRPRSHDPSASCTNRDSQKLVHRTVYSAAVAWGTYVHRRMFSTDTNFTVSQLYKSRFPEDKLLKLARTCPKQKVQTQLRTCRQLLQWMVDSLIHQFCAGRRLTFQHLPTLGHRKMFLTGGRLTVSQLYKSRFPEDKLLKLARTCQNQRVQTQFRPNILRPNLQHLAWKDWYTELSTMQP